MRFRRGDHICSMYSTGTELVEQVAEFLADGLGRGERCWYVGMGSEIEAVRSALRQDRIDVESATARQALRLITGESAYVVQGAFDPETTIRIFNDAIEQAWKDGFTGFRAAAEMSWALTCRDGAHQVIVYEALLRPVFATCRAIGLCLYDRTRMPLDVIDGALATHPLAGSRQRYAANPFYDPTVTQRRPVEDVHVHEKLKRLDRIA